MATIEDVAKRAGVAPITVSRVINNSGYCSEKTRRKVEAAITELGYVPNSLARGLRLKKTKTIGLVITDITNPFFTVLARGVEDAASNAGFHVFLCNTDESETKQTEYLTALLQRQVDGFLLVPARSTGDSINLIRKHGAEVVVIDRRVPSIQVDVVRCDSELGAFRLIMHLLELGHKRIAYLGGPLGVSTAEDRFLGYKKAMCECNLEVNEELVLFGDYTQQSGYELTRRTLQLSPRPTAIFAANNFIAIGALQYLRKARINIPHEISLVTFDDLPPSLLVNPFLTTTTQPSYEMGQQAAKLLLTRLNNREVRDYREVILPTETIVRTSSGPPPILIPQ